jgi:NAD(P)-dependent dehydrogenase (short-subunit alcohol dehydrogenase family)
MSMTNSQTPRRIALVTGANKGIGLEIARQLAAHHGMTVLIGARDEARGRDAADRLRAEGLEARWTMLDVTDQQTIAAAARRIETEFGRLDVLVNNAAVALDRRAPPSRRRITCGTDRR